MSREQEKEGEGEKAIDQQLSLTSMKEIPQKNANKSNPEIYINVQII